MERIHSLQLGEFKLREDEGGRELLHFAGLDPVLELTKETLVKKDYDEADHDLNDYGTQEELISACADGVEVLICGRKSQVRMVRSMRSKFRFGLASWLSRIASGSTATNRAPPLLKFSYRRVRR